MEEIAESGKRTGMLQKKRSRQSKAKTKKAVEAFFELEANKEKEKTDEQMYQELIGGNVEKKRGESKERNPLRKERKGFRHCAKTCLLTYPQCDKEKEWLMEKLMRLAPEVVVVSKEDHHETEGKHLHAFVEFGKKKDIKDPRYFDFDGFHPNIGKDKTYGNKTAKSSKIDMIKYVIKDGDYIEYGIDVKKYLGCVKSKKAYIDEMLVNGKMTLVEAVKEYPMFIHEYGKLKTNLLAFKSDEKTDKVGANEEIKDKLSIWIYGTPGIGKSYSVRQCFTNVYNKIDNKWWNNYKGQQTVLIDDFDNRDLFHELKIWADRYMFDAEVKGGYITPYVKNFIVTSNYSLNDFVHQQALLLALKRRFIEINADDYIVNGHFDLKLALRNHGVFLDGETGLFGKSVEKKEN